MLAEATNRWEFLALQEPLASVPQACLPENAIFHFAGRQKGVIPHSVGFGRAICAGRHLSVPVVERETFACAAVSLFSFSSQAVDFLDTIIMAL